MAPQNHENHVADRTPRSRRSRVLTASALTALLLGPAACAPGDSQGGTGGRRGGTGGATNGSGGGVGTGGSTAGTGGTVGSGGTVGTGGASTGTGGDTGTGGTGTGGSDGTGGSATGGSGSGGHAGSTGSGGGAAGRGGSGGSAGGGGSAGQGGAGGGGTCNTSPGKALQFSGSMIDLMTGDLGNDLPGGDVPRTIEVWAKYTGSGSWTPEHSILETGKASGGSNRVLGLDTSGYMGTTAEFGPYTNGYSDNNHQGGGVFVPNIPQVGWIHFGWSYAGNGGALSFTVNGKEYPVKTQAGKPMLNFFPGIVTLAASQNFGTQGFGGILDEVRIWSVARKPEEIARDMKVVLKGTEPGLVAYYRFEEGSGTFTDDVSGKMSHRLSVCTSSSARCPAANQGNPVWVDSDLPGPFTCAE